MTSQKKKKRIMAIKQINKKLYHKIKLRNRPSILKRIYVHKKNSMILSIEYSLENYSDKCLSCGVEVQGSQLCGKRICHNK
jgi:hypothetical protein